MKRAFTLVEMVVVLGVIALVTHLALESLARFRDARLAERADRQLEDLRRAVYGEDRAGEPCGFLADMGRLPCATNGTLSELWREPPAGVRYAVRRAVAENLAVPAAFKGASEPTLADANVYVPTGWRGPYVRLPLGRDELTDPWGNPFVAEDEAGLERLSVSNGFATAISHYGAEARLSTRRTLALRPDGGESSRLVLTAVSRSGAAGEVWLKWYGPASGLVTGDVARAAIGETRVFEGLTPGVRIVRAGSVTRRVRVAPGDNLIEVELP